MIMKLKKRPGPTGAVEPVKKRRELAVEWTRRPESMGLFRIVSGRN
jgi:hypothetical protein